MSLLSIKRRYPNSLVTSWPPNHDAFVGYQSERSLDFDGVNEAGNCGTCPFYTANSSAFSLEMWVYAQSADFNGTVVILADSATANTANNGFWLALDDRGGASSPTNGIRFQVSCSSDNTVWVRSNNDVITSLAWYHIIVVYSTGGMKIYVDGADQTGGAFGSPASGWVRRNANMYVGAANDNSLNYDGGMDEIVTWDVALSAAEVSSRYGTASPSDPATHSQSAKLLDHWKVDSNDSNPTIDNKTAGNNMTLINMEGADINSNTP